MRIIRTICWICAFLGLLHVGLPARAQTNDQGPQTPSNAPAPVPEQPALKPAELEALVAPIALYPDTLMSNVLMASTYPLEVVHADRWMKQNKNLKGDALKAAAEKQDWDASVKALIATPSVLQMMNERLEWTQKLGEAFLAQQQDVMDAVQRLRSKAYDRKKLVTTKEQTVTVKAEQNRQFIYIEPAVADSIYVPYYEPQVVFGDWPYSDYPAYPYYWGYPDYIGAGIIAAGVAFGTAYALGRWATGGYWGGGGWWGGSRVNWVGGANRHQSRRSRRALATRRKASTGCTLQQFEPATEVRQRQSEARWRSAESAGRRRSSERRRPGPARRPRSTLRPRPSNKQAGRRGQDGRQPPSA
ncbi:hypothetical protein J2R80_004321 [Bradyrhizobium sp. USDA 4541]|nr:DUF3300 domain-containing protein [Bradyrhizobium sp. USDA 4541]MCP1850498.1 hypothetical protein [Bradyrhizobium sp. USDA 4541]